MFPRPAAAREVHTTFPNPFSDIRYIATKCLGKKVGPVQTGFRQSSMTADEAIMIIFITNEMKKVID